MVSAATLERDFRLIAAAAIAGERCPQSYPHGTISAACVTALVRAGRIRSEVYRGNWRVITILKGEHKGKSTAPYPDGGSPYLVNGVPVGRGQHAPRYRAAAAPVSLPVVHFLKNKGAEHGRK
jgi:hypothetical protein